MMRNFGLVLLISFLVIFCSVNGIADDSSAVSDDVSASDGNPGQDEPVQEESSSFFDRFELNFELRTYGSWRNDSDFTRTAPDYNAEGQSQGLITTVPYIDLQFNITDNITAFWSAEIPNFVWGRNYAGQVDDISKYVPAFVHRELWAQIFVLDNMLGFRAGIQHIIDPTRLVVEDWIGAGSIFINLSEETTLYFTGGMIPDSTYEGFVITENNFNHDNYVAMLGLDMPSSSGFKISPAITSSFNKEEIGKGEYITSVSSQFEIELSSSMLLIIDVALQMGLKTKGDAFGTGQLNYFAYAGQVSLDASLSDSLWMYINLLALSPEDGAKTNKLNTAFHYSGRSRSKTLYFSENELHDRFDNLDEDIANQEAGLGLFDISIGYEINDWFNPYIVLGTGTTFIDRFIVNNPWIGLEADIILNFHYEDYVQFDLAGGVIVPGGSASAVANTLNLDDNDVIGFIESRFSVYY